MPARTPRQICGVVWGDNMIRRQESYCGSDQRIHEMRALQERVYSDARGTAGAAAPKPGVDTPASARRARTDPAGRRPAGAHCSGIALRGPCLASARPVAPVWVKFGPENLALTRCAHTPMALCE